jgi:hypothetical protein
MCHYGLQKPTNWLDVRGLRLLSWKITLEAANWLLESSLKASYQQGLHIIRTPVQAQREVPVSVMNVNDRDQILQGTTLSHCESVMWAAPVKASELQTSGNQVISEQLQNVVLTPGMTSTQQNQEYTSSF